jgi:CRP-like cAMP-binding protein
MGADARLDLKALMEMAGTLKDVLPLDILPEADREELARQMRVREFKAGDVIYRRGDPAHDANVVFSGSVEVTGGDDAHQSSTLHRRGQLFGDLAMVSEVPRDGTAVAVEPTTVLQISRTSAWRVLERNAKAREWMFRRLGRKIGPPG